MKQQQYKVGAYCRLSREDEDNIGESGSITNQREMIKQYCAQNNLEIEIFYQDDGFTGTNFERPDFKRMIEDIESGKINCVITKDLSRLGRDHIMTGYYLEIYFPQKSVRYIAIGDNYDNLNNTNSANDFAAFKMVFNDLYSKDISNKSRAARYAQASRGEHSMPFAPYGYKKDPQNRLALLIDEETAPIVKLIFEMYLDGNGSAKIRNYLTESKILCPSAILHTRGQKRFDNMGFDEDEANLYRWSECSIGKMLQNELYVGNNVHYRHRRPNHKGRMKKIPKEQWMIVENTHEPIVDQEVFDSVQRKMGLHAKPKYTHENIFTGLIKCADCGKSLGLTASRYKTKKGEQKQYSLCCSRYRKYGKDACSCHYIDYPVLCELVHQRLNILIKMVKLDETKLIAKLKKTKDINPITATAEKKIIAHEKRLAEIDKVFMKLYEDRALGSISEDNYKMLSGKLSTEKSKLVPELDEMKSRISEVVKTEEGIQSFVDLIRGAEQIAVLDAKTLAAFVDRIEIHETVVNGGERFQQVDIDYKFIGKVAE